MNRLARGRVARWGLLSLALAAPSAHALISCSLIITPVTTGYDSLQAADTVVTGTVTINCSRALSDPSTMPYSLAANDGLNSPGGGVNRVALAPAQFIAYELYRSPSHTGGNAWSGNKEFTGTINFGAGTVASDTQVFDLVVTAGQTGGAAGTYTDTVATELYDTTKPGVGNKVLIATGAFTVNVIKDPVCTLTKPVNVSFSYTSFQAADQPSTGGAFTVTCTAALPYTMALDQTAVTDIALNLSYNLSVPAAGVGTDLPQNYAVTGLMAGGQGGNCTGGCNNLSSTNKTRTLTITY